MAKRYSTRLLTEDWSAFPIGPLSRDNTARGECMAMVVPERPGPNLSNGQVNYSIPRWTR